MKYNDTQLREFGLARESLPRHVAAIMDGNGRWAKARGLLRSAGHRAGTERLRDLIRFSSDAEIEVLTLYAFSSENWARPQAELSVLFSLLVEYFTKEIDELHAEHVRIRIIGDVSRFPANVRRAVTDAENRTAENAGLQLNIALNYGARAELLRAARHLCEEYAAGGPLPDEAALEDALYTAGQPPVDLLIRTSGELRVSNFLLWQIAYAEFYITSVYWPDFTREEYIAALRAFAARGRRFGGL
ncbi:MAG: polyprenyl diphosphate synthase [Clostridiales bacterium]|nr:polyprenyl diphosphate synthase [Clostridiales bacterium]